MSPRHTNEKDTLRSTAFPFQNIFTTRQRKRASSCSLLLRSSSSIYSLCPPVCVHLRAWVSTLHPLWNGSKEKLRSQLEGWAPTCSSVEDSEEKRMLFCRNLSSSSMASLSYRLPRGCRAEENGRFKLLPLYCSARPKCSLFSSFCSLLLFFLLLLYIYTVNFIVMPSPLCMITF